ncbi:MAG: aldehyde dehydrogenase family protein [Cyanobacteria bacterium P01_A01_bin.45]
MSKPIEVRNPRNGKYDYVIVPPPPKLLAQQCKRLRRAQKNWREIGLEGRVKALQEWREGILSERDNLVNALTNDTGRLRFSEIEVDSLLASIDYWCGFAPRNLREFRQETSIRFIQLQQSSVPYELVGVISPWSFPLQLSTIDIIPALLAGCAVVVKPSEIAPRFMIPLIKALNNAEKLRDVLAFIEGDGVTGKILIEQVDFICFTGHVSTGIKVAEAAVKCFIPSCLELGGKDPAIVLESANLELATSAILWGSILNTGQSCRAIERIYVAKSIYEDFFHKLVTKAHQVQLNDSDIKNGGIGPIVTPTQAKIIEDHLQEAIEKGATIHCGGKVEEINGGYWCRPTVITDIERDMKIMKEETFGPIMPVMPFSTLDEAVNLANDCDYGMSAAIFAADEEEALLFANDIEAGSISINDAALNNILHEGETNPFKFSSMGSSRTGASGLQRFLRQRSIFIKTKKVANPWWFDEPEIETLMNDEKSE